MRGAELVSGKQTAFVLLVLARFHFDVERQAALVADALKRAVQSVEHSLDRDRRHVQEDARMLDELGVRILGPSAHVLLRGRIFKHQQHETREEKHRDIHPLHDASQNKLQQFVERKGCFRDQRVFEKKKSCEAWKADMYRLNSAFSVVGRDSHSSFAEDSVTKLIMHLSGSARTLAILKTLGMVKVI